MFSLWYWLPRRPPWDTGIVPPEVERFVASHPPGRALDLGCGTGTNVVYLADQGGTAPGGDFAGRAVGITRDDVAATFADTFQITRIEEGRGRPSAWYTLMRR